MLAFLLLGSRIVWGQSTPVYPPWWSNQAVLNGNTPDDFAAANQGQAKNMARAAINELDNDLAQFGGSGLDALASTVLSGTATLENDYAAINLGQLKSLAQPFYDRLLSLGYFGSPLIITGTAPVVTGTYPWISASNPPDDFAAANLGQLKYLFSFDVMADANGNGIPDWWEQKYFPGQTFNGQPGIDPNGLVPWGGGQVTNLQAYQNGWNPLDFYNGQTPTLTIVSGDGQTGSPGKFVPAPVILSVSNTSGPLAGAPITFTVSSGTLWKTNIQALSPPLTMFADSNGQVKVYFELPATASATSTITVTAGGGSYAAGLTFTENSDGGNGTYADPFDPSNIVATLNPYGSADVSWTNNTDPNDTEPINIQDRDRHGNWVTAVANAPAGTTSYHVPAQ